MCVNVYTYVYTDTTLANLPYHNPIFYSHTCKMRICMHIKILTKMTWGFSQERLECVCVCLHMYMYAYLHKRRQKRVMYMCAHVFCIDTVIHGKDAYITAAHIYVNTYRNHVGLQPKAHMYAKENLLLVDGQV
jgi:hypothetical protein